MKMDKLKQRLQKDRTISTINLKIPADVIEDLQQVAPLRGFSSYQSLIKAYIGQGLRADLKRLDTQTELLRLVESLRKQGVRDDVIAAAMAETQNS